MIITKKEQLNVGMNILSARKERGLSQVELSDICGIKDSTISLYENNKKSPNIATLARLASALNVSIDRLYYGDENKSFNPSETNINRKTVNAIYFLWDTEAIEFEELFYNNANFLKQNGKGYAPGLFLRISKHQNQIKRLLSQLDDYKANISTYKNPNEQLEIILSSAAAAMDFEDKK